MENRKKMQVRVSLEGKTLFLAGILLLGACKSDRAKVKGYTGEDMTAYFLIIRDKESKQAVLKVNKAIEWKIYAGSSVEQIDLSKPVLKGAEAGDFVLPVNDTTRSYFQVVTPEGSAVLAERHLPMAGGFNYRDMGGYKTRSGQYVKWGKVFRSDDLHHLTAEDLNYLASIPLVSIVDFRSPSEMAQAPDIPASSVRHQYAYSIAPGNLIDLDELSSVTIEQTDQMMKEMNLLFVTDSAIIAQYRKFFHLLQDEEQVPLMFHCSAGKDRTGMGAALFLATLGVDEETIYEDYLLSNKYLGEKYASYIHAYPQLEPLFQVKPEFLRAGLEQIKAEYGTIENFIENELKVDIKRMKDLYLEK